MKSIFWLLVLWTAGCSSTATGTGDPVPAASSGGAPAGGSGGAPAKRAFVTSQTYSGALKGEVAGAASGVAAADALCKLAADAATLGGTFKAYLGDDSRGPSDALADVGPWYLLATSSAAADTRLKVFNNKANLSTSPMLSLSRDEQGHDVTEYTRFSDGSYQRYHAWRGKGTACANWTAVVGKGDAVALGGWQSGDTLDCAAGAHLYCFEQ